MKNGPYTLIIAPDTYPGKKYRNRYAYEHHIVWWENTKTFPPNGYIIHHKNGETRDNRFDNLELIHLSTHIRIHKREKRFTLLVCKFCQKPFSRESRNVEFRMRRGETRFFCCHKHQLLSLHKGR